MASFLSGTKLPDTFDSISFAIDLGGEPWPIVVSFDNGPCFNSPENPIDCLTIDQIKYLIAKLTEVVDTVDGMTQTPFS